MADTTASLGIEVKAVGVQQATSDLDKLNQSQKAAAQSATGLSGAYKNSAGGYDVFTNAAAKAKIETTALAGATTATAQSTSLFQRALSGIGGLFGSYSSGANTASSSMSHLAGAHGSVATAIHVLNPLLLTSGTNITGLGRFALLARAGLEGLAVGLTGAFVVALETAADKVSTVQARLKALLGQAGGQNAFDSLKSSTDKANTSLGGYLTGFEALERAAQSYFQTTINPDTLRGAELGLETAKQQLQILEAQREQMGPLVGDISRFGEPPSARAQFELKYNESQVRLNAAEEQLRRLQEQADRNGTGYDGATVSSGLSIQSIGGASSAMSEALQLDKKNATEAATAVDGYLKSIAQYGGLTKELYQQIEHDSPTLSAAISKALGGDGSIQAQATLEGALGRIPLTLRQIVDALNRAAPQIQADYEKMKPNISQAFDMLKTSVENLLGDLGKSGNVGGFLSGIVASIKNIDAEVQKGTGFWSAFWKELSGNPEEQQAKFDQFQAQIRSLFTPPQGWQTMWNQLGDLIIHALHLDGAKAAIQSFLDETDKMFQPWIQSVANSIMSVVQKAVAGIQAMLAAAAKSPLSGALTSPGMPSFDASGIDLSDTANLSDTSNLMTFAQGGLTQVTGPSGTDKTLVSFMATNGEIVAVGNPSAANAASGGSSGAAVSAITQPITAAVQSSTSQIVSAITNASTNATANASTFPYGQPSNFSGSVNIKPYVGNPAGTMSDYASYSDIYGPDPYDPGPATPDPTSNSFANGFYGYVGGSGGTDSKRIGMNVTPGELVSVTPPNKSPNAGGDNRKIIQNFYFTAQPGRSQMSAAQMKRAMQQAMQ